MGYFDDSGSTYTLSGDEPQMSMAGTGGQGYAKKSKFRSFLDAFNQQPSPIMNGQYGGAQQRPSILGGLSQMGGGGALGAIGKFARFLV